MKHKHTGRSSFAVHHGPGGGPICSELHALKRGEVLSRTSIPWAEVRVHGDGWVVNVPWPKGSDAIRIRTLYSVNDKDDAVHTTQWETHDRLANAPYAIMQFRSGFIPMQPKE